MPFLLIGGYAVMAYGYVRTTEDIDLLIRKSQAAEWQKLLEDVKFAVRFSGPTFLQFTQPAGEKLPLDLMFVADQTFDQMFAEAGKIQADDTTVHLVSLPHLFALKCHAFHSQPHRALKDIEDLVQLTRINNLDLNEPSLRAILLKHGGRELYELLKRDHP